MRATFANAERTLVPGLFARIQLDGGNGPQAQASALLISDRAVGTDQSRKYVYVIGADNKAEYRAVKLGPNANGLRVVREGLKAGEKIVVNGLQRVRPGAPVTPQMVAMDFDPTAPAAPAKPAEKDAKVAANAAAKAASTSKE